MKKIFVLSKHNLNLAKEEVLSLLKTKDYELFDNILITEDKSKLKLENRLGYTHKIYKFLFKCNQKDFITNVENYAWEKIYKKDFCVRIHNSKQFSEKDIASIIWNSLKKPKVNLEKPGTKIDFIFINNIVIAGLFLSDVDKSFLNRKAHLRPSLHPTSLHPGLAKACINLTGLETGTILDPFCGSAGILIEAALMNFNIIGYDLDKTQLERAKINLDHYKIKNYKLINEDARNIHEKVDAIVTDLPYGKGSKVNNPKKLYKEFLENASKVTNNMIIIFPDFVNHKKIISKTKWKVKNEFTEYIHKSLSRKIVLLFC